MTHSLGCECPGKIYLEPHVLRDAPGANLALLAGALEEFAEFTAHNRVSRPRGMNEQDVNVVDAQRRETLVEATCRDGRVVRPGGLDWCLMPLDGTPEHRRFLEQCPRRGLKPAETPSRADRHRCRTW